MSDRSHEPQQLLESLLSPEETRAEPEQTQQQSVEHEDLDALIDEFETMLARSRRMPFGRKLMVDEEYAMELVDRLRASIPGAVRQAGRILEQQDTIIDEAREEARRMLHERGLMAQLEVERERVLARAEQDAERMRGETDAYIRGVLGGLEDRLAKLQAGVRAGIEALGPVDAQGAEE